MPFFRYYDVIILCEFGDTDYKSNEKGEIMKRRKRSFEDLVLENKMELLKDLKQMEKIEERLENRHMLKAE
ncbi:hypothetical protein BIV59_18575 [Bacillus sp. MUM 13]|nr:hypothetical protein BIV59_18575 [Bacillus sp. MUM 13]